jgi:hypothetical protein
VTAVRDAHTANDDARIYDENIIDGWFVVVFAVRRWAP